MKWAVLALFALTAPAYADAGDEVLRGVEVWDHPQHVAEIVYKNAEVDWAGGNKYYRTYENEGVTFVVEIDVTANGNCVGMCPDWMRVIDITPGFMAYPSEIEVPENGEGVILIMEDIVG